MNEPENFNLEFRVNGDGYEMWDRSHDPENPVASGTASGFDAAALLAASALMDWVAGFNSTERLIGMDFGQVISRVVELSETKGK